jgi:SAM-dependent methyltransferase
VVGIDALVEHGLVEIRGDVARATVSLLPHDGRLLVCDRAEHRERDSACWPDDSSQHLAATLPARAERWLDLGTGSGYAPLARPQLAKSIVGVDINARAVRYAWLGAELSDVTSFVVELGDLAAPPGSFDLVTCNAPIPRVGVNPPLSTSGPDDDDITLWRTTDDRFLPRLFDVAGRALAPDGLVVVHAVHAALVPVVAAQRGERVVVAYTPPGAPTEFAVVWWAPGGKDRLVCARRELVPERPHLDHDDRVAALAGELPPL